MPEGMPNWRYLVDKKNVMKVSRENYVKVVYDYFTEVGIIVNADTPSAVTNNTF